MATKSQDPRLADLIDDWHDCTRCPLGIHALQHVLYDCSTPPPVDVLFVGEAPGPSENVVGKPFVNGAPAGKVLRTMISELGIASWGMTNIISCFPFDPGNVAKFRLPNATEAKSCEPRLIQTVEIFSPQLIVLAGKVSKKFFPRKGLASTPIFEIDHPSYIQRNGGVGSLSYQRNLLRLRDYLIEEFPKWQPGKRFPRKVSSRKNANVNHSGHRKKA